MSLRNGIPPLDMIYYDTHQAIAKILLEHNLEKIISFRRTANTVEDKSFRKSPIFEPEVDDKVAKIIFATVDKEKINYHYFPSGSEIFTPVLALTPKEFITNFESHYEYAQTIFPIYGLPATLFNLWFALSNRRVVHVLPESNTVSEKIVASSFILSEDAVGTYLRYTQDINKLIVLAKYEASEQLAEAFSNSPIEWLLEALLPKTQ